MEHHLYEEREERFKNASKEATEMVKMLTGYDNDDLGEKMMWNADLYNAYNLLTRMIMELNELRDK